MESRIRAFMDIPRMDPGYRPVEERIKDYRAVERQLSHEHIRAQASRCMDCGTPFCHAYGCPLSNVIPEFNSFVHSGRWEQALHLLLSTNPFPEFTGRICPAPCEAACVAGLGGDPVTIRQIEQAIAEMGFERDIIVPRPPRERMPERVAVVGSGPAGLAAADLLNRNGYGVTVFESAPRPGGLLCYGIPDFKMEKWVLERRIHLMREEGVRFETNVTAGVDVSHHYLRSRFHAVVLACGAREPRDLDVRGRELEGIHWAMDFLTQQNMRSAGELVRTEDEIHAQGKKVVVIGGGDTGSDCVGTALRQGAESVELWEIMPRPPEKRSPSTPWPEWPLKLRKTHAHEEGCTVRWAVMTKEIQGLGGRVRGLRAVEVQWEPGSRGGRPAPVERPGTEFLVDADLVILSMGFVGPARGGIVEALSLPLDARGAVNADRNNRTPVPGVFAAGDMNLGQSLVVRAVRDGREAARNAIAYLREGRREMGADRW